MWDTSRGLRDSVVHGLAKVGLVWALAVLGTLFVVSAAHGSNPGAYAGAAQPLSVDTAGTAPRTIGLALTLVVLAAGLVVLAVGAAPRLGAERVATTPADVVVEPDAHAVSERTDGRPDARPAPDAQPGRPGLIQPAERATMKARGGGGI